MKAIYKLALVASMLLASVVLHSVWNLSGYSRG